MYTSICLVVVYCADRITDFAYSNDVTSLMKAVIIYNIVPVGAAMFMWSYLIPVLGVKLAGYPVVKNEKEYDTSSQDKLV